MNIFLFVIMLFAMIFIGKILVDAAEKKQRATQLTKKRNPTKNTQNNSVTPSSIYDSQVLSYEFSFDLKELSPNLDMNLDNYIELYKEAFSLYTSGQVELASIKFHAASNFLENIRRKYPNNFRVNFELLETYQGCDWEKAIQQGFRCLKIVDNLLEQKKFAHNKPSTLFFSRYDVMRKLYKLLIKQGKMDKAIAIIEELLISINLVFKTDPPPYDNHKKSTEMSQLSQEKSIATFFLEGIKEGRDIQKNIVVSPETADESPELCYYFHDAEFSPITTETKEKINIKWEENTYSSSSQNTEKYYEKLQNKEGYKVYREALEKNDADLFFQAGESYDRSYISCYGDIVFSGSDEQFFTMLSNSLQMPIDFLKSVEAFSRDEIQKSLVFSCHCYVRALRLNPNHYMANLKLATALTAALRLNEAHFFWIRSIQLNGEETINALSSDASGLGLKAFMTRIIIKAIQNNTVITEQIIQTEFIQSIKNPNLFYSLSEPITIEDFKIHFDSSEKKFRADKYFLDEVKNLMNQLL